MKFPTQVNHSIEQLIPNPIVQGLVKSKTGFSNHPLPNAVGRAGWFPWGSLAQRPGRSSPGSQILGGKVFAFSRSHLRSGMSWKEGDGTMKSRSPAAEALGEAASPHP